MGTKVQIENYMPGHCSMRDLSRESNGGSWPSCYSDYNNLSNGQFYCGFVPRTVADSHPGYDKDVVKQTILEHEAVFKNQVYELHRLYQVQRDLMAEVRRNDFKRRTPYETSSSSSPVPYQTQSEDVQKWNGSSHPFANSVCGRHPIVGPDTVQSFPHSAKGKNIELGSIPFKNGYSPKNSDLSESRPTKFRRRMLDLQLPADEYFDTDELEHLGDAKASDGISPSPGTNGKFLCGIGNLFVKNLGKSECHGDATRSDSRVSKSTTLADLNEPLHVEETNAVSSVDFLGWVGSQGDIQHGDLSAKFLRSSKDATLSTRHGSMNGTLNNLHFGNRPNGQDRYSHALESEQHNSSQRTTIHQGILPDKAPVPSQPVQILLDQACQPPAFPTGDRILGDLWKTKPAGYIEKPDRSYSLSSYNMHESKPASHVQNQPSLVHPSDMGKSYDQFASSWGKPSSLLSQKSMPVQTSSYFPSATSSKSPKSSAQSNDLLGSTWNLNNHPEGNIGFASEPPLRNGFYQGSSTSFKETPGRLPHVGFDYVNCNYSDKTVACLSNNHAKTTTCTEVNTRQEMNLNVPLPNCVSDDHISQKGLMIIDKDHKSEEDPSAVLPWLRRKDTCSNEAEKSSKGPKSLEPVLSQGQSMASSSCDGDVKAKKPERNDFPGSRKILGVPIFDSPPLPEKENSTVASPSVIHHRSGNEEFGRSGRKLVFDINVPCDPTDCEPDKMVGEEVVLEKKMETRPACVRNQFDLNSCITEAEVPCGTSRLDNSGSVKSVTGIDLEAPVVLDSEEVVDLDEKSSVKEPELPSERADDGEAELAKSAAEAIVAISSSVGQDQPPSLLVESTSEDPLHWFVDIACQLILDENNKNPKKGSCLPKALDEFESMILTLKECNAEEYFPKPSITEIPNVEENGKCVLSTRTRKGHTRRGRQRRDFQRDILPGLASLSRHEVTEDLQTFGGLMRALGHPWQCGPNRRNATRRGFGRERRRSLGPAHALCAPHQPQVHSKSMEVGLEDRSLTGWGKTTRRPRRQRCPSGNPQPPVPFT